MDQFVPKRAMAYHPGVEPPMKKLRNYDVMAYHPGVRPVVQVQPMVDKTQVELKRCLDQQEAEISSLKSEMERKDEDIFAMRFLNAELKIDNNRKDEQIAGLRKIIMDLLQK